MTDKENLYAELFEKYHISLQNFCMAKGVGNENADDIVSEAFARTLEHSPRCYETIYLVDTCTNCDYLEATPFSSMYIPAAPKIDS